MKNILLFAFIVAAFTSCKKIKEAAVINFKFTNENKIQIPAFTYVAGVTDNLPIILPAIATNSKSTFESYNTSPDRIEDVRLSALSIQIDQPTTQNFNFLKSVSIYISSQGLAEKRIAYLDNVPLNVSTLDLVPTGEKLDEFIKKDTYDLRVDVQFDESNSQDINATAKSTFDVRARLIK